MDFFRKELITELLKPEAEDFEYFNLRRVSSEIGKVAPTSILAPEAEAVSDSRPEGATDGDASIENS
jgi:hypothetical protein